MNRIPAETISITLAVPTGDGEALHHVDVSLAYAPSGLHEIAFVGRGKIGHGMDHLLHDLGIKLSRAIQGRDPETGAERR